jgi:DNA replication protein DnaC
MNPNWQNAIKMMNIQGLYHNAALDNCPKLPPGIVDLGKRWIKASNRPNLYIHGNTGSGKTYFATALFRAMVEKNFNWLIFVRSDDLDTELLTAIENKHEKTTLMKYFEVPILFIDDLGVERPTDRMIRQYYSIIDKRVGEGLLTIITSNVPREELPLGDRTLSRLEHFYNIEFPKKDIRKSIELPTL